MNKKLSEAMSYVNERYVAEAAARKKRRYRVLVAAVAAVLAVVILINVPSIPLAVSAKAVSVASESRKMKRPDVRSDRFDIWYNEEQLRSETVNGAVAAIADFAREGSAQFLTGDDDRLWSPINAYIALGMTAELTGGDTRQSILEVLGVSDTQQLRTNISAVWEDIYEDDGKEISVLANSLWLDDEVDFNQDTMDALSYHYYASVYQRDLQGDRTGRAISNWLSNQTGGFMKKRTGKLQLDPNTLMALASTIYFQSQWSDEFSRGANTQGLFHAPEGDVECTFMNKKEEHMNYYWAEDYGAVQVFLENGSYMWFILPDADKTIDDVLQSGDYAAMITRSDAFPEENHKWMKVNLSMPKFDVSASVDLKPGLQNMGLTGIFEPLGNDFSASVESDVPVYLQSINQDTRVTIDEKGVTAASYIELLFGAMAAEPPQEIIDFVLDRPFLFAICSDKVPLFIGTVQTP